MADCPPKEAPDVAGCSTFFFFWDLNFYSATSNLYVLRRGVANVHFLRSVFFV